MKWPLLAADKIYPEFRIERTTDLPSVDLNYVETPPDR
jgi:hypothetical protein